MTQQASEQGQSLIDQAVSAGEGEVLMQFTGPYTAPVTYFGEYTGVKGAIVAVKLGDVGRLEATGFWVAYVPPAPLVTSDPDPFALKPDLAETQEIELDTLAPKAEGEPKVKTAAQLKAEKEAAKKAGDSAKTE